MKYMHLKVIVTKSEITDLTISDSIKSKSSYSYTLTLGTEFFGLKYEGDGSTGSIIFTKTNTFDAYPMSKFRILVQSTYTAEITYVGSYFNLTSGSGKDLPHSVRVIVGEVTFLFTVHIVDSEDNVVSIYTVDYGEVDSSNLLTFGAIDEKFARKTDV